MEISGSIHSECNKRLEVLYKKHHNWLGAVAYNISKNMEASEDLVSQLYLYLGEKCNPDIWYLDSYNLQYCRSFIQSRFINEIKRNSKMITTDSFIENGWDMQDSEYDEDADIKIDEAYDDVRDELDRMKKKKGFASAMIYQHYWFSDMTLDEVSKAIGISKSTTFLAVKKTKEHLKKVIQNPFKKDD